MATTKFKNSVSAFADLLAYTPPPSRGHSPQNSGTFSTSVIVYSSNRRKTMLAFVLLLLAMICNDISLAWIHERVPTDAAPLPDVWFSVFPEYTPAIKITETLIVITVVLSMIACMLHERRWAILRRGFFIAAWVYLGRAICITITQVPVPSRKTYCGPKVNHSSFALIVQRVATMMSGLGMELHRGRELCGDLIYCIPSNNGPSQKPCLFIIHRLSLKAANEPYQSSTVMIVSHKISYSLYESYQKLSNLC